jgi:glycosyltransferase involved in cell wall biosynthesis
MGTARFATSISRFDRELLLREGGRHHADRIHVVRCGIDGDAWRSLERRIEPGLILSVGALREKKGHHVLIEACARLRDEDIPFSCEIVGEGSERGRLERDIGRFGLGSRVRLLGAMSPEETRARYVRAEIFALPCVVAENGDLDGVPIVLMEAMMAGIPCVSTRLSGIPEIIEDGASGLLADVDDAPGLTKHLAALLGDADRRAALGRGGQERASRICERRTNVGALADLIEEAIR